MTKQIIYLYGFVVAIGPSSFLYHKQKFVMLTFDILKLECKWLLTFFANCNVRKCEWWSYHDWGVINVVIFLTVIREATAGLTSC